MMHVTSAEAKLADALRRAGISYQANIFLGPYEVDFVVGGKLVIEVDGFHHYSRGKVRQDAEKDQWLLAKGYDLLRITNTDVVNDYKLKQFVQDVKAKAGAKGAEGMNVLAPLNTPELQALRDRLEAKERQRQANRKAPTQCDEKLKSKRELEKEMFLRALEGEVPNKDMDGRKR